MVVDGWEIVWHTDSKEIHIGDTMPTYNTLTWLRPIDEYTKTMFPADTRHSVGWNALIKNAPDDVRSILQAIYFKCFDSYCISRKAMQLMVVNRTIGKRWVALFKNNDLPLMDVESGLRNACVSNTLPLLLTMHPKGGMLLLPAIVSRVIHAREEHNYNLLAKLLPNVDVYGPDFKLPTLLPDAWIPLQDINQVRIGAIEGPELSRGAIEAALSPFEKEPAPVLEPDLSMIDQLVDVDN